ncbi:MAG: alkaline phosphatase [Planctomycetia bacterium]|nr:alkaline phosphatase [Planctomycetia bacterium]
MRLRVACWLCVSVFGFGPLGFSINAEDYLCDLQTAAIKDGKSPVAHWGVDPNNYKEWGSHSNRLIPVYTFGTKGAGNGVDLTSYTGKNSAYRNEAALRRIYGRVPSNTLNPGADYLDQTDLATLQRAAFAAGKKHVILMVFDGMDWHTTRAASIYNERRVSYSEGRGTGTHFQNYAANETTQFGSMCVAPHNDGTDNDVDTQTVANPGGKQPGGYNVGKAGATPWAPPNDDIYYLTGRAPGGKSKGEHAYPDSANTAEAMTTGVKSYNNSINVDYAGHQVTPIAHEVQANGFSVGTVTSVPISHATPACSYAHNVDRDDYQDLTRDLLGLPSIAHPQQPLRGLDVLIGGGYGDKATKTGETVTNAVKDVLTGTVKSKGQGANFVPGNIWLTDVDRQTIDVHNGGKYVVAERTKGLNGRDGLNAATEKAIASKQRLLGFYGALKGHLPFATADGDFKPTVGRTNKAESYTEADLNENPTLADMTASALAVLSKNPKGFWLMVEAGDVDWANHDNNLDNSIGAVNSGDKAFKVITDWVEQHSNWNETVVIVTADHGHFMWLDKPEGLIPPK